MYIPEPDTTIAEHVLSVERQGPTDTIVTVRYRTIPITASPSRDYQPIADGMVLVFHEGENIKNITVRVFPDDIPEPNEVFHVELYDPSGELEMNICQQVIIVPWQMQNEILKYLISKKIFASISEHFL